MGVLTGQDLANEGGILDEGFADIAPVGAAPVQVDPGRDADTL